MNSWGDGDVRMYLVGSPAAWWGGAAALVLWTASVLVLDTAGRRTDGAIDASLPPGTGAVASPGLGLRLTSAPGLLRVAGCGTGLRAHLGQVGALLGGGWVLQYLPYWIMGRVTYLHHYLPAVLFLGPLVGVVLDATQAVLAQAVPAATNALHVAWAWTAVTAAVFVRFAPVAYGMTGPPAQFAHLQWRPLWTIADDPAASS